MKRIIIFAALTLITACGERQFSSHDPTDTPPASDPVEQPLEKATFASIKKNIFARNCLGCHSPPQPKGDLDLTDHAKMMKSIKAFCPDQSELTKRLVSTEEDEVMPPPNRPRLSAENLAEIDEWIRHGAPMEGKGTVPVGDPCGTAP